MNGRSCPRCGTEYSRSQFLALPLPANGGTGIGLFWRQCAARLATGDVCHDTLTLPIAQIRPRPVLIRSGAKGAIATWSEPGIWEASGNRKIARRAGRWYVVSGANQEGPFRTLQGALDSIDGRPNSPSEKSPEA
jgi:hypothetical protein